MCGSSASGAKGSGGNCAGMMWLLFLLNAPRSALTDRAVRKRIPADFDNQPRVGGPRRSAFEEIAEVAKNAKKRININSCPFAFLGVLGVLRALRDSLR